MLVKRLQNGEDVAKLAGKLAVALFTKQLSLLTALLSPLMHLIASSSDFGSAKVQSAHTGQATTRGGGTEGWQSPEAILNDGATQASDVFSLGLLYFFVLTEGGHCFGELHRQLHCCVRIPCRLTFIYFNERFRRGRRWCSRQHVLTV